jgi:hypothetical protein
LGRGRECEEEEGFVGFREFFFHEAFFYFLIDTANLNYVNTLSIGLSN